MRDAEPVRGAVVLCGGRSTRMGRDKAALPFGPESLLQRVVRRVSAAAEDVVVVARPGQDLPPLADAARVVRDEVLDHGPIGGLGPGLAASRADAVFVTACDAPFVSAAVIGLLFERLGTNSIAVAETEGFAQPLCAVYRTPVLAEVEKLLAAGRLRPAYLFDVVPTVRVTEPELRAVDPDLAAFMNCNAPAAYDAALARRAPLVQVELFDLARRLAGRERIAVDAATLGDAVRELSLACPSLGRELSAAQHWRFSLNGERFVDDSMTRLADGDSLLVLSGQAGG